MSLGFAFRSRCTSPTFCDEQETKQSQETVLYYHTDFHHHCASMMRTVVLSRIERSLDDTRSRTYEAERTNDPIARYDSTFPHQNTPRIIHLILIYTET